MMDVLRYAVQHGGSGRGWCGYIVWDAQDKRVAYQNDDFYRCIRASQRLNGFTPIDGKETTYRTQVAAATDKWGRDIRAKETT